MQADSWERQTPDPSRVRILMGGFGLLGVWVGVMGALLQLWALHLRLGTQATGNIFLLAGLGSVAAPLMVLRLETRTGRLVQRLLVTAGALAAVSFVWLSRVVDARGLLVPLFLLGLALGALNAAIALMLGATLTPSRTMTLAELAGVFFSGGALLVCLLLWVVYELIGLNVFLWLLAGFIGLAAWRIARSDQFEFMTLPPASPGFWQQLDLTPKTILLVLALILESGTYWTIGGWLALYLGRKFGTTSSSSLAILAAFWLALTCGRVAAQRLPPLEKRLRCLVAASGLCLLGSIFLIQTADISGAVVGALFLGGGLGLLHPLTLGAILGRQGRLQPSLIHAFFLLTFSGGLLVPWGVGYLAAEMGIDVVVWTALAASILIFILLGIVVIESKLDERTAPSAS